MYPLSRLTRSTPVLPTHCLITPSDLLDVAAIMYVDALGESYVPKKPIECSPFIAVVRRLAELNDQYDNLLTSLSLVGLQAMFDPALSQTPFWDRFARAYVHSFSDDPDSFNLASKVLSRRVLRVDYPFSVFPRDKNNKDDPAGTHPFNRVTVSFQRGDLVGVGGELWATRHQRALYIASLFSEDWAYEDAPRFAAALCDAENRGFLSVSLLEDKAAAAAVATSTAGAAAAAGGEAACDGGAPPPCFVHRGETVEAAVRRELGQYLWENEGVIAAGQLSHDVALRGVGVEHTAVLQAVLPSVAVAVHEGGRIVSWKRKTAEEEGAGTAPAAKTRVATTASPLPPRRH